MTYYDVLGVDADAPAAQIRRAYVTLARAHHPDFHTNADPTVRAANERAMQAINEAWAVLSDPDARRRYDARSASAGSSGTAGGERWERTERRRASAEADEQARASWQPFDLDDDDVDPRLLDDEPERVVVSRSRQLVMVLPTLTFIAGVALIGIGLVINLLPLAAIGLAAIVLSTLAFFVLPLLALSASARDDRR